LTVTPLAFALMALAPSLATLFSALAPVQAVGPTLAHFGSVLCAKRRNSRILRPPIQGKQ